MSVLAAVEAWVSDLCPHVFPSVAVYTVYKVNGMQLMSFDSDFYITKTL